MSVVFDPDRILSKVLPQKADDLLTNDLKFRDKFKQNLLRLDFLTKGDINKGIAKSLQFYNKKTRQLKAQGESAADAKADAINGGALLKARLSDLVVEKASEDIKEKFTGKRYIWLPSSADDPDPVHALNYGKTFTIGEGEQPGERYGCRCAMEILGVDTFDKEVPDIMRVNPDKVKAQLENGKARAAEAAKRTVEAKEKQLSDINAKIAEIEARAKARETAQKVADIETVSKGHIAVKRQEFLPLFDNKGRFKDFKEFIPTTENKKLFFRSVNFKNGKRMFENNAVMGEKEFELFYKSIQSTTNAFPKLLEVSHETGQPIINDYLKGYSNEARPYNGGTIYLLKGEISMMENVDSWAISYKEGAKNGHFPKGTTVQSTYSHELGHAFTLKSKSMIDLTFKRKNLETLVNRVLERDYGVKTGYKSDEGKAIIENGLSRYAKTEPSETLAEAFSEYCANGKNTRKLAKSLLREWRDRVATKAEKTIFAFD